jgi:hypothetical protein
MKATSVDNLTVKGNTFLNNRSTGMWCDVSCTDTVIEDNQITGSFHSGISYEVSARASIKNNWIVNTAGGNGTTAAGIKLSNSNDVTISNNALVGNYRQLGVYDIASRRDGEPDDQYSRDLALPWKTFNTRVNNNNFVPGTAPNRAEELLKTLANAEVSSNGMFAETSGNIVNEPTPQKFVWWTSPAVPPYNGLCAFEAAVREFGTSNATC